MDSTTCGAGATLTSLCGSLATSRRRSNGGDENPTTAALDLGLGLWWRLRTGKAAAHGQGGSGEGRPGGGAAYNGPGGLFGVRATRGRHAPAGLGRRRRRSLKRGRRCGGDDGRDPRVSDPGLGRPEAAGAAGPRGTLVGPAACWVVGWTCWAR
jgi:hypothetical protein